ncbi:MAG: 1-deoxy-D-xylulose-5-phosphate synthase [Planctomycetes bacterium GWF2_42_9]|nr:MAG: 1-deoxy-D-xylulose-5-phosphate synthase [Planctomycetes bacterium GWF2_42_9]
MYKILEKINSPADLKALGITELTDLAQEVRQYIIDSVSATGGHLASNLGVVELTIAMHYVFDLKADRLLWDVGHQCYAHKILTGRKELFKKLRTREGISGFPNPDESPYDQFAVGHAGTAIATALGLAIGEKHVGAENKIIALVGDASIVNGLSFEGLNNMGLIKRQMLIVLNDNSMAIDATQGSWAGYLSKVRLSHSYEDMRNTAKHLLEHMPLFGKSVETAFEKLKKTVRMSAATGSQLFESLNIPYFGPVDGHNMAELVELFKGLAKLEHPAVLHVYTKKGKGFTPAHEQPSRFHSTGPFKINGESAAEPSIAKSFTDAFGESICRLASKDKRVLAITAAMCDGTGLTKLRDTNPTQYIDVGIAESAAVTMAAGMAKAGARPFVCVYSTFMQRAFDQIFQEVAMQNLPVVFCFDRAGLVGADGATHHGLLDIGMTRMMPNMVVLAPADEAEMQKALEFALTCDKPVAIRYPRDVIPADLSNTDEPWIMGKSRWIAKSDTDIIIVSYGNLLGEAVKAAGLLEKQSIKVDIIDGRFAKPLDTQLCQLLKAGKKLVTLEEHSVIAGFGSALLEQAAQCGIDTKGNVKLLAVPDRFVLQGSRNQQLDECGLSAKMIAQAVKDLM